MLYQIKYAEGRCHNYANGRKDLLEWLDLLKEETITDVVKVYKNGTEISVLSRYQGYIRNSKQKNSVTQKSTLKVLFCVKTSYAVPH